MPQNLRATTRCQKYRVFPEFRLPTPTDRQLAHSFIERDDSLGPLANKAQNLIELRRCFRSVVPAALAGSCEILNYRNGIVVIGAGSSAAAAKIRQLTTRLAAAFVEKGWQVSSIQVQVQGASGR